LLVTDKRIKIAGSSLLGVFARCTEKVVIVPQEVGEADRLALEDGLKVEAVRALAGIGSVLGSLVAANSNGFVVTHHAGNEELKALREYGRVARLPARINAAGNVILANDSAALVHPGLSSRACEAVEQTLGVKVEKGTIGGLKTVGMAGVATNKGLLLHPRVSEEEIAVLERLFELPVDVGTVNLGSPLVGSGVLANSRGYFAGEDTSGPELGRIEDALGFLV
jgi:translation initiation factor 6